MGKTIRLKDKGGPGLPENDLKIVKEFTVKSTKMKPFTKKERL